MKNINTLVVATVALGALALSSCETPTGQGAGIGAATGALIGGAATGSWSGAAIGAGIGAGTGALVGAAVEADQRGYYGGHPTSFYPYGRETGTPGFYRSPYAPHSIVNTRGIPHGSLVRDPSTGRVFRKP